MAGAAIVIGFQQLKGLLGITHFTNRTDVVSVIEAVWRSIPNSVISNQLFQSPYLPLVYRLTSPLRRFLALIDAVESPQFYAGMCIP